MTHGEIATVLAAHDEGVVLALLAVPRSGKTEFDRVAHGAIRLRVGAPPVEGAANAAIVKFLAAVFQLPRAKVRLLSGATSRHKRILLVGLNPTGAEALLLAALDR